MYQQFPQENGIIADKTTLFADLKLQLMRTHHGTFLYSVGVRITWFTPGANETIYYGQVQYIQHDNQSFLKTFLVFL